MSIVCVLRELSLMNFMHSLLKVRSLKLNKAKPNIYSRYYNIVRILAWLNRKARIMFELNFYFRFLFCCLSPISEQFYRPIYFTRHQCMHGYQYCGLID
jgi:hypothetical protein